MIRTRFLLSVLALILCGASGFTAPVTTESLLRETIDMHRLTDMPNPAYKTVQFSSYDHRSTLPGGPEWFANSDGFGSEPVPNFEAVLRQPGDDGVGEYLICDVQQPGAIVRVWTAAIKGYIRVYLDGNDEPVWDGTADDFLRRPYDGYAKNAGIDASVFEGTLNQRNAAYCPFPFAKRCKIVWTGNLRDIHFYQIQIRLYEPGTEVFTFESDDLRKNRQWIRRVAEILANPHGEWVYPSTRVPVPIAANIPAHEKQEILQLKGQKAVERLTLKLHAEDINKALRQTVLHIYCDGYPWGQVQAPVGDFFGAAPGINPYDSVPFTVEPDGTMTCRYAMPFANTMRILLDNRGEQPVTVTGSVLHDDFTWNDQTSMHFRARWRVDHDLVSAGGAAARDLPYLVANGAGRYVGTSAMLLNPSGPPTPGGSWWGEGDEKIFVDDDRRPSTFGTGSEDYFNYAWSAPDIFVYPYCGQPRNDGPANRGFVTNQRWHILDDLPFQNRIGFYMGLFSHHVTPDFSYARIAYHYARPGVTDDHVSITDEDVRHLVLPEDWRPAPTGAASKTVFYEAEELIRGDAELRYERDPLWSGGWLAVWRPEKKGAELEFTIPVLEEGNHSVNIGLALTPQSGKISRFLDGEEVDTKTPVVDLHKPHRILSRYYEMQPVSLTKGEHRLKIRYEGPGEGNSAGWVGIDFIGVRNRD